MLLLYSLVSCRSRLHISYCSFYLELILQIFMSRLLPIPASHTTKIVLYKCTNDFWATHWLHSQDPDLFTFSLLLPLVPTPFLKLAFAFIECTVLLLFTPPPVSVGGWHQDSVLGTLLSIRTLFLGILTSPMAPWELPSLTPGKSSLSLQTYASVHTTVLRYCKPHQAKTWNHFPPKPALAG